MWIVKYSGISWGIRSDFELCLENLMGELCGIVTQLPVNIAVNKIDI